MIAALIAKDFKLFFRNQLYTVITALGLILYIAIYFLLPATIDDSAVLALYVEDAAGTNFDERFAEFADFAAFDSEAALVEALNGGDYAAGLALSTAQVNAILQGQSVTVDTYLAPGIPADIATAYAGVMSLVLNSLSPATGGQFQRIEEVSEVLGPDLADGPLPLRDRLVPMLLLFILSVEILGLATLIMQEAEQGTARALLTTPLRTSQFFTSKVLLGIGLAFAQVLILVIVTGKITTSPLKLLTILLLGSLMVTGLAFLVAAVSKDNLSVLAWGMLIILGFSLPATTILFPALSTAWIDLIPSFYLVNPLHQTLNYGATWADIGLDLLVLLAIGLVALAIGSFSLRRRFA